MTRIRPGHPYLAGAPLLMAHRGGAALAPENTLAAFGQAVDVWRADALELDVRATADGRIVVIHDDTVDRTTDGTGPVASFAWDALRELDAGYRFLDPSGEPTHRGRGVRVPLFEEVLEACPRVRINVETKERAATRGLLEVIRQHGAQHRVLFAASHEPDRAEARGYEGPWGASAQQIRRFYLLYRLPLCGGYTPGVDALQVPDVWQGRRVVTPRFVEVAHRKNIAVHVWTVDEVDDMRRLLGWGVDGVQTDRPDRLARLLTEEFGRPPAPGLTGDTATASRSRGHASRAPGMTDNAATAPGPTGNGPPAPDTLGGTAGGARPLSTSGPGEGPEDAR